MGKDDNQGCNKGERGRQTRFQKIDYAIKVGIIIFEYFEVSSMINLADAVLHFNPFDKFTLRFSYLRLADRSESLMYAGSCFINSS